MLKSKLHYFLRTSTSSIKVTRMQHSNNSTNPCGQGGGSGTAIIGTHDGTFHCDEVLACALLKRLPRYQQAQIIRTRDPELLKTCTIVVDVGNVYDPATNRFDHHQKSFVDSMSTIDPRKPWTTRLSSAGLVYAHFGREILSIVHKSKECEGCHPLDNESLEKLYDRMYVGFVEAIDAIDNGISLNQHPMAYKITTDLSSRIGNLNPGWKDNCTAEDITKRFHKAMTVAEHEFLDKFYYLRDYWLEAYHVVSDSVKARFEVDPSGVIVEFRAGGVPWKDHLAELETSLGIETLIQYVIYPDGNGQWRVQCVPIEPTSFISRTPLKKEWQGLRDKELKEISGIPTISFVHANGFIGGAAEREDVIQMAKRSLK